CKTLHIRQQCNFTNVKQKANCPKDGLKIATSDYVSIPISVKIPKERPPRTVDRVDDLRLERAITVSQENGDAPVGIRDNQIWATIPIDISCCHGMRLIQNAHWIVVPGLESAISVATEH